MSEITVFEVIDYLSLPNTIKMNKLWMFGSAMKVWKRTKFAQREANMREVPMEMYYSLI